MKAAGVRAPLARVGKVLGWRVVMLAGGAGVVSLSPTRTKNGWGWLEVQLWCTLRGGRPGQALA